MSSIIVSDIHLSDEDSALSSCFFTFLDTVASEHDDLYILGDCFDQWVGDDAPLSIALELKKRTLARFKRGQRTFFMHGNRDFLVGPRFCHEAKMLLVSDPFVSVIENQRILMTHGDLFCTEDKPYLRYRKWVRNRFIQALFLTLPTSARVKFGDYMRSRSRESTSTLSELKIDQELLASWMTQHSAEVVLQGHVHRPEANKHSTGLSFILGDWSSTKGTYIVGNSLGMFLKHFSAS